MSDFKKKLNNSTFQTVLTALFALICALLIWVYVTDTLGNDIDRDFPGVRAIFQQTRKFGKR